MWYFYYLMMVIDLSLHEAIDDRAFADSAVTQEDHFHLDVGDAAGVEFRRVHYLKSTYKYHTV